MKTFIVFSVALAILFGMGCQETGVAPTPLTHPDPPKNLTIRATPPDGITITWEHTGTNVKGFILSRGSRKFGWVGIARIDDPTARAYVDRPLNLSSAKGISYLLFAYNDAGESQEVVSDDFK